MADYERSFDKYDLPQAYRYYWELMEVAQFDPTEASKFKSGIKKFLSANKVQLDID